MLVGVVLVVEVVGAELVVELVGAVLVVELVGAGRDGAGLGVVLVMELQFNNYIFYIFFHPSSFG